MAMLNNQMVYIYLYSYPFLSLVHIKRPPGNMVSLGRMAGLSAPEDVCLSLSLRSVLRMEDGIIHLRGESFRLGGSG